MQRSRNVCDYGMAECRNLKSPLQNLLDLCAFWRARLSQDGLTPNGRSWHATSSFTAFCPASVETALEEAGKLESIEAAKKRLEIVKTSTGALPVVAAVGESETLTPQANALGLDPRVDELTKEVKRLTQELAQLRGAKGEQRPTRSAPRRNPNIVCWNCRGRGHIQ